MQRSLSRLSNVDDLATLLEVAELDLGADGLADALWLAQFLPSAASPEPEPSATQLDSETRATPLEPKAPATPPEPDDQSTLSDSAIPDSTIPDSTLNEPPSTSQPPPADSLPVAPASAPDSAEPADADLPKPSGISIQLPATPALRASRDLAKALRPLKRQVPSRTATVFDAEATTECIADQGIWTAVMAPAPERWFDLAIVVEQSRSTPLWRDTLDELKLLAERQGTFRRVSTWQVRHQQGHPTLQPQWRYADTPRSICQPRTLIDPAGRRLIWLVSDCTSPLWEQSTIYEWLRDWGQYGPTTLVQLFPGRLWERTALGDGWPVQLSTFVPGMPNVQLQVTENLPFYDAFQSLADQPDASEAEPSVLQKFRAPTLATVPVVSLEAYPLRQWAKVMTGSSNTTPGYQFNAATIAAYRQRKQDAANAPPPSALDRVRRFHNIASPLAIQLAGLMASAPVSPPIIQLLQQTLLPQSQQVHVAEVYMGGLLKAITPADLPPHQIEYDFLSDEVRDALIDRVPIAKTEAVLEAVSAYLSERLGLQVRTYEALLLVNYEALLLEFADRSDHLDLLRLVRSFAYVAKRALRRLGGDYAALVDYLESPNCRTARLSPNAPELKTLEFEYPLIAFEPDPSPDPIEDNTPALQTFTFETVQVNNRGKVIETISGSAQYFVEVLDSDPDTPTLDMVAIPGGTFLMGSPDNEPERYDSEGPQHEVTVPPFFMAKTPITQAQWRAVAQLEPIDRDLAPDPSRFKDDNRPVENVAWYDATEFCARLSQLTGRGYRLPSEAEWEYACRAGTTTPFYFGETITPDLANYDGNYTYGQGPKGINRNETTEVGSFPPNAFGLYDMHGNVWEWCQDHWHSNYEGDPPTDGSAWLLSDERKNEGSHTRKLRGGSWIFFPRFCRSAFRSNLNPDARDLNDGFRVVCSAARALP